MEPAATQVWFIFFKKTSFFVNKIKNHPEKFLSNWIFLITKKNTFVVQYLQSNQQKKLF